MGLILDTTALSDFLQEEPGIKRDVTSSTSFNIPVIVLGEYRFGFKAAGTPLPENDLPLLSKDRHFDNVQGISRLSW
jgi:predicted nucleic acid-binding protein